MILRMGPEAPSEGRDTLRENQPFTPSPGSILADGELILE